MRDPRAQLRRERDEARALAMVLESRLAAVEYAHEADHECGCDHLRYHAHGAHCATWLLAHGVTDDPDGAA